MNSTQKAIDEAFNASTNVVEVLLTVANVEIFNYEVDEAINRIELLTRENFTNTIARARENFTTLRQVIDGSSNRKFNRLIDRLVKLLLPETEELVNRGLKGKAPRASLVNLAKDLRKVLSSLGKIVENLHGK